MQRKMAGWSGEQDSFFVKTAWVYRVNFSVSVLVCVNKCGHIRDVLIFTAKFTV